MKKKSSHRKYGELKTDQLKATLTPTGKEGIETLANSMGISVAELLERIGRGELSLGNSSSLGESLPA